MNEASRPDAWDYLPVEQGGRGFTTPKHAKQHGKHGLNFSFSLSVFCDNFGEDSGPNNHIISPNPY